jgi:cellobiose dehydrogenase (acceptor)
MAFRRCSSLTARAALAQSAALYTDEGITFIGSTDVSYSVTTGYAFPPVDGTATDEFIGEIVSPVEIQWVGVSPGGGMLDQLLLVAWPNGEEIVSSARYAE